MAPVDIHDQRVKLVMVKSLGEMRPRLYLHSAPLRVNSPIKGGRVFCEVLGCKSVSCPSPPPVSTRYGLLRTASLGTTTACSAVESKLTAVYCPTA